MSKGFDFERSISKQLSYWFSNGERDDIFWKTSGSGARATTRSKKKKKTAYEYGDISFKDPVGLPFIDMFLIELKIGYSGGKRLSNKNLKEIIKKHKGEKLINQIKKLLSKSRKAGNLDSLDIIDSKQKIPQLIEWWEKAKKEQIEANRISSIIIFKRDGKEICVMVENALFFVCDQAPYYNYDYLLLRSGIHNLIIMRFDDFFELIEPEKIIELSKAYKKQKGLR